MSPTAGAAGDANLGGGGGAEAGAKAIGGSAGSNAIGGMGGVAASSAGTAGSAGLVGAGGNSGGYAGSYAGSVANAGRGEVSGGSGGGGAGGRAGDSGIAGGASQVICNVGFADCNYATTSDGCETYLNSLKSCGTNCSNGVACAPDQVCNAGSCVAPQGMVKFSVPLTDVGQSQRFGYKFPPTTNLANSTLFLRLYAPGAQQGNLYLYPIDADYTSSSGLTVPIGFMSEGWADFSFAIGGVSGSFDPGSMYQVSFEIHADSSGPWANPTLIYVDSIWSSNGVVNETFAASLGPVVSSTMMTVTGSTMTWVDTLP